MQDLTSDKWQQDKKNALVEKKKLVTFVAVVTHEIKSKTERIQVIVKAVKHNLEITYLIWEEVG